MSYNRKLVPSDYHLKTFFDSKHLDFAVELKMIVNNWIPSKNCIRRMSQIPLFVTINMTRKLCREIDIYILYTEGEKRT